jgi:dihydrofolate synthase / folylpolyglutamate synthase
MAGAPVSPTPNARAPPGYTEALGRLYGRRRFGMRPGLDTIRALLKDLGDPQKSFSAIHVAGSKGKGSVALLTSKVLEVVQGPAGLYTSPHLASYRERIRVNGEPIDPADVVEGFKAVERAEAAMTLAHPELVRPTFFEFTTALAFLHFHRKGVRSAAIEVGMGGELDATNILKPPVGVISTIELEHTDVLGSTLTEIARAKSGILKSGMRAVVGETKAEPLAEIEHWADLRGVPLWRLGREIRVELRELTEAGQTLTIATPRGVRQGVKIPLQGTFQARNAALAVGALELWAESTGIPISDAALREGFAKAVWRGRLERIAGHPEILLDVAHTPESARALAESIGEISPFLDPAENVLVFGCLQGKLVRPMLESLSTLARTVVLAPIRSQRSLDTGALKREAFGLFPRVVVAPSVAEGLKMARAAARRDGFVLATGSDYLVGEVLNELEGRQVDEPDLSDPGIGGPGPGPGGGSDPGHDHR